MTKSNVAGRRGRRLNLKQREALTGWLFVSPALIGLWDIYVRRNFVFSLSLFYRL